jgi:hypothetical protein
MQDSNKTQNCLPRGRVSRSVTMRPTAKPIISAPIISTSVKNALSYAENFSSNTTKTTPIARHKSFTFQTTKKNFFKRSSTPIIKSDLMTQRSFKTSSSSPAPFSSSLNETFSKSQFSSTKSSSFFFII